MPPWKRSIDTWSEKKKYYVLVLFQARKIVIDHISKERGDSWK